MKKPFLIIISILIFFSSNQLISKHRKRTEAEKEREKLSQKMVKHADDGNLDKVKKYIQKGAWVNFKTKRKHETALHKAAEEGHVKIVEYLLSIGADVNAKNKKGETALHEAAQKGNEKIIKILLAKGANINAKDKKGRTSLMNAVNKSKKYAVKMLLEAGANVKIRNKKGKDARNYSRGDISKMLDEHLPS